MTAKEKAKIDLSLMSSNVELMDDGVWRTESSARISYPVSGNAEIFAVEERSYWFRHRNDCISTLVEISPPDQGEAIFEIGAGNGFVGKALENQGHPVVAIEPGNIGATNARKRGLSHVVCATLEDLELANGSLGAIGMFDVLEHLKDPDAFLRYLHTLLKPLGKLYISVPAFEFLWSAEDARAGHFRRYRLRQLSRQLEAIGFSVDFGTYFFRPLPLPIFLLRTLPTYLGLSGQRDSATATARDHGATAGTLARSIELLLKSEVANIRQQRPMAFGSSCLISASKR